MHVRACYCIKQVLSVETPSVERMNPRRARYVNLLPEGECISRSPKKKQRSCPSRHSWTDAPQPEAQPPSGLSIREPPALSRPSMPLQVFSTLVLSALLLLAVKTETFYGVYKPEVTQLNETICHIKFTSARIKCQIT